MESKKFDALAKGLASGNSRRSVIGGLFGGAFAMVGLSRATAAPAAKVDICHYDADNGVFFKINVSSNAQAAHLAHGDFLPLPEETIANFSVDATNPNAVDSGVFLANGDTFHVTITGEAGWCCGLLLDANGSAPCGTQGIPFNCGSVVGVIGGGDIYSDYAPFFDVGTDALVTGSGAGGNLWLQYVDGCSVCTNDNNGILTVTIAKVIDC